MGERASIKVVVIEWRPTKNRVTVRGVFAKGSPRLELLEPENIQNYVQVFEGIDHKSNVGFDGLQEME